MTTVPSNPVPVPASSPGPVQDDAPSAPSPPTRSARSAARRVAGSRLTPRKVFWVSFLAFFSLTGAWALASPMASAPDEATHLIKAAGVVRGQLTGEADESRPGYSRVEVPSIFQATGGLPNCYAFKPTVSAGCSIPPAAGPELSQTATTYHTAGSYNPLYYSIVGLASFAPAKMSMLYLMRLVSAALVSLTLALAMRSAAEVSRPGWAMAGVFLGVTPMVAFLGGVVNPNSIEASAGLGLCATLGATVLSPRDDLVRRRMWRSGVLVVLLANAKPMSLLMLAIIVLVCCFCAPWARTWAVLRDRRAWPGLALGTVGALAALAWLRRFNGVFASSEVLYPELSPRVAADIVLRETGEYMTNMLGQFGWVDTALPVWQHVLMGGLILLAVLLAAALGSWRERAVLVGAALLVAGLPLALQVPTAQVSGIPWQGRYLLAIAVALPVLSGLIVSTRAPESTDVMLRPLAGLATGGWAMMHVLAFAIALRRYAVGANHPYFQSADNPWVPPYLPWPLYMLACTVGVAVLTALVVFAWRRAGIERAEDAAAADPALVAA